MFVPFTECDVVGRAIGVLGGTTVVSGVARVVALDPKFTRGDFPVGSLAVVGIPLVVTSAVLRRKVDVVGVALSAEFLVRFRKDAIVVAADIVPGVGLVVVGDSVGAIVIVDVVTIFDIVAVGVALVLPLNV